MIIKQTIHYANSIYRPKMKQEIFYYIPFIIFKFYIMIQKRENGFQISNFYEIKNEN